MSTKNTEYELAVRIAGKVDKTFDTSLAKANKNIKSFSTQWKSAIKTMDKGYDKIMNFGTKAFTAVTTAATVAATAVVGVSVAAAKAGIEFESAFAGVRKTVDATEEKFAELRQDVLDMSTSIPSTAVEIAGVMEVAGQLGIGTEYLTDFTETMINLGVSTNMAAEEAATSLAKFANITGMNPEDYEKLGSTIVDLGNNFATTELDIVEMSTRLAATGELTGLTEAQILALSTAMSSVGIAAETGGSTMSKLLKKMQVAIETESDVLQDYASVANMTSKEFSQAFEEDAVKALSAFIDGLNDTERNGKSAIVLLNDLGLNEIRLSNTILSLANSHGVMSSAIDTANQAWDENTALAIEAGRRYETTESKIQVLKNAVYALGVEAFEEMEGPLKEGITWLTEGVINLTDRVGGPNGLGKWIGKIKTTLPAVAKNAKTFGKNVLEFAEPLLDVGKWLVKNPEFLSKVFVATGTALATYKVVSGITSIVTAVTTLASNPVMLGIAGVVALTGLIAVDIYNARKEFEALVDMKLDSAFGDIALSLEDIQEVASYIVDNGSLSALTDAMTAFEELGEIQGSIDSAIETLNKMNWKVSIGMELDESDQAEYQQEIDAFVKGCQDYILQQRYSLSLALNILGVGADAYAKTNTFYNNTYSTMSQLGINLSQAVNEAFADNILTPEEMVDVAEWQRQMSEIQQKLAGANFEASVMSFMGDNGIDLSNLDAASFSALQSEVTTQLATATEQYKVARDQALASAVLMKDSFNSDAEYQAYLDEIWKGYLDNVSGLQATAADYLINGIEGSVMTGELETLMTSVNAVLAENMGYVGNWRDIPGARFNGMIEDIAENGGEDLKASIAAMSELLGSMQGTIDMLKETEKYYIEHGLAVPENLKNTLAAVDNIIALSDIETAIEVGIGQGIVRNEEYSDIYHMAREASLAWGEELGAAIPEGIVIGFNSKTGLIVEAINSLFGTLPLGASGSTYGLRTGGEKISMNMLAHADGGIFTKPHIAAFAEAGPEAAIPLDGSRNALSLWAMTGRLLGMGSVLDGVDLSGGSSSPHIEYKPQLNFYGAAPSQSDLESALRTSQDEFDEMMRQWLRNNSRVAFQ